jgi:hypothetical protein
MILGSQGVTKAHIASLESVTHYFLKGYGRAPGAESISDPLENKVVVFEDFFAAGLHMPPHPVLLDILCKFWVQLHQLTLNAIVQISKFIWAVTSCGGHPIIDIFAHHYELHYQDKKIHLEGSDTTFTAQFGCISFHPSRFGNWTRLNPIRRNKWTSGWDGNWFYCWVPVEQKADVWGKGSYLLSSTMTCLNYLMEAPSSGGSKDANFVAFVETTSSVGGRDAVEEFLASGLWPLSEKFGFKVETKESPLSKVVVLMPQIDAAIRTEESRVEFAVCIVNTANLLVGNYNVVEHNAYQGLQHGWLNHVFKLAGVLCQPRPNPIVWKRKPAVATLAPAPRKTSGKWGRGRKSFDSGSQTFVLEVALAEPVKSSSKFIAKSFGLSVVEKATVVSIRTAIKKTHSACVGGSSVIQALTRALYLFDSGSSVSDDETNPWEPVIPRF